MYCRWHWRFGVRRDIVLAPWPPEGGMQNGLITLKKSRIVKKLILTFFLVGLIIHIAAAQPGPYSGVLSLRVFDNGKMIDLNSNDWKVSPIIGDKFFKSISYTYPDYYIIKPQPGPGGAQLNKDFHIEIVHLKDTMKIYMPSINYKDVKIDSIPFARGTYHVPQHIYDMKQITDYYKAYNFTPKINGDWNLFTKKVYQCYLEKVQDVDMDYFPDDYSHNYTKLELMNRLSFHDKNKSNNYYYLNNIIVYGNNHNDHKIYLVCEISDTTFWGSKIGETRLCFLYAQNGQVYAIASRSFGAYIPGIVTKFGIYKLHFYDALIDVTERQHLKSLLDKDIYKAVLKTQSLDNDYNSSTFLPKIIMKYKELNYK
jgi:hypothetical protein